MGEEILTIDEAARAMQVAPDVIESLLVSGDIPGKEIAGEWRTTMRALVGYVDGQGAGVMCCPPGTTCCVPAESAASAGSGGGCCG